MGIEKLTGGRKGGGTAAAKLTASTFSFFMVPLIKGVLFLSVQSEALIFFHVK